jgi:hypothetical protein
VRKQYKVGGWRQEIEICTIVRETDKCVWIKEGDSRERRELKKSRSGVFFNTWREAHEHVVANAVDKIRSCQESLLEAEEDLVRIENLKNPEVSQ